MNELNTTRFLKSDTYQTERGLSTLNPKSAQASFINTSQISVHSRGSNSFLYGEFSTPQGRYASTPIRFCISVKWLNLTICVIFYFILIKYLFHVMKQKVENVSLHRLMLHFVFLVLEKQAVENVVCVTWTPNYYCVQPELPCELQPIEEQDQDSFVSTSLKCHWVRQMVVCYFHEFPSQIPEAQKYRCVKNYVIIKLLKLLVSKYKSYSSKFFSYFK